MRGLLTTPRLNAVLRRGIFLILLAMIVFLGARHLQSLRLTSTGDNRGLDDLSLPRLELGIDVISAMVDHADNLEVWCLAHGADDLMALFAIPGAVLLVDVDMLEG